MATEVIALYEHDPSGSCVSRIFVSGSPQYVIVLRRKTKHEIFSLLVKI